MMNHHNTCTHPPDEGLIMMNHHNTCPHPPDERLITTGVQARAGEDEEDEEEEWQQPPPPPPSSEVRMILARVGQSVRALACLFLEVEYL
jgi:hypothetical protein